MRGDGAWVTRCWTRAWRKLCCRLNCRCILAGGRLWNYHEHASHMSPQEYAERVAAGEFRDLVLSFQLREGFRREASCRTTCVIPTAITTRAWWSG